MSTPTCLNPFFRPLKIITSIFLLLVNAHSAETTRPNIVFILADDMGIGDTSSYGGVMAKTPQLERLAKEGIRFTR